MAELFAGAWGPLLIFGLRIFDVSLATIRMLLTMRDRRLPIPFIGMAEAAIWVVAVGTAIQNLHSVWHVVGYSAGFAAGTLVGMWLEAKMAMGLATIQIVSRDEGEALANALRHQGFGVTELAGYGREGKVEVLWSVVKRRHIQKVVGVVEGLDDDAFISVEEPRAIRRGWMFPARRK